MTQRKLPIRWIVPAVLAVLVVVVSLWLVAERQYRPVETSWPVPIEQFECHGCNVIFLNIELLRAHHTGLIGGGELTPVIDRYFEQGIIFHDVSAPAGETFLGNTAILTGAHPFSIDITGMSIDRFNRLDDEKQERIRSILTRTETWAEILSRNGYHTISINQGGRAGAAVFLDRGFDDVSQWSSDVLLDDMVDVLIDRLEARQDKPVFALFRPTFLHNYQYRAPTLVPELEGINIRTFDYKYSTPDGTTRQGVLLKRDRRISEEMQRYGERAIYASQLKYGDMELARLFEYLDRQFRADSIIVLYANHGSGLGDNDTFNHGTSYQASIHVPLFILHPKIERAIHVTRAVSLFDLAPTISKMIGVGGVDWSMTGAYNELIASNLSTDETPIYGKNSWDEYIRVGDWKLLIQFGRRRSLFDLSSDPSETRDLVESHPDRARELESILVRIKANYYSKE